jgi:hypothetical protein
MKKIVRLTESDLTHMVKRVLNEKKTLNEQFKNDGDKITYKLQSDYIFNFVSSSSDSAKRVINRYSLKSIKAPKGYPIEIKKDLNAYRLIISDSLGIVNYCGSLTNNVGVALKSTSGWNGAVYTNPTYTKNTQKLFCNGGILKTWEEMLAFKKILNGSSKYPSFTFGGEQWFYDDETNKLYSSSGKVVKNAKDAIWVYFEKYKKNKVSGESKPKKETPKKDSKCKFTEKEFKNEQVCFIPKDNTWMYAKTDDGKWYTSKQSDRNTWCELTTPKFQTAVDKLNVECKGLTLISKLELKPISPIS